MEFTFNHKYELIVIYLRLERTLKGSDPIRSTLLMKAIHGTS